MISYNQAKELFNQELLPIGPPTVQIKSFGGSDVHILGSITIFLHVGNKTFKALCQVTDKDDCFLMGRVLANAMGYVDYPDIMPPTRMNQKLSTSVKSIQAKDKHHTHRTVTRSPQTMQRCKKQSIKKSRDPRNSPISKETLHQIQRTINRISSNLNQNENNPTKPQKGPAELHNEYGHSNITISGKEHSLPTTMEYILKEYGAIFTAGIADDIIVFGENEIEHDVNFTILCETARINGLKLNTKKLLFKSNDCNFFGHKLTPDRSNSKDGSTED